MASLQEVCELAFRQIFPVASRAPVSKEEFIATGKYEWAYQTLMASYREKQLEGYWEVPSYLSAEIELEVKDGVMDISGLKTFKSLPQDSWLQSVGGVCECNYIKTTFNLNQLLCKDDCLPDDTKTYYIQGQKIKFPQGVHKSPLPIVYATMGADDLGNIQIDEAIAALVRVRLNELYLGKVPPSDETNNLNPNN